MLTKNTIYCTISNQHKPLLGYLIKLERLSQKRIRKELVFLANEKICSPSTLAAIESGMIIKNDLIYHHLLNNLGFTFREKSKYNILLSKIEAQLYKWIISMNESALEDLYKKINLLPDKDFLYGRLKTCYLAILSFSLNEKRLSSLEYTYFKQLLSDVSSTLQLLLINLCFLHANYYIQNLNEILYFETYIRENQNDPIMSINLQVLLARKKDFLEFFVLNHAQGAYFHQHQFTSLYLRNQALSLTIGAELNRSHAQMDLDHFQVLWMKEKNRIHPALSDNFELILAMIDYVDFKQLDKAIDRLENLFIHAPLKFYMVGIFYFDACERLKIDFNLGLLTNLSLHPDDSFLIYFYHKYIDHWSNSLLVHFLTHEVLKSLLIVNNASITEVFNRQFKQIVLLEPKKYYKLYFNFMARF